MNEGHTPGHIHAQLHTRTRARAHAHTHTHTHTHTHAGLQPRNARRLTCAGTTAAGRTQIPSGASQRTRCAGPQDVPAAACFLRGSGPPGPLWYKRWAEGSVPSHSTGIVVESGPLNHLSLEGPRVQKPHLDWFLETENSTPTGFLKKKGSGRCWADQTEKSRNGCNFRHG